MAAARIRLAIAGGRVCRPVHAGSGSRRKQDPTLCHTRRRQGVCLRCRAARTSAVCRRPRARRRRAGSLLSGGLTVPRVHPDLGRPPVEQRPPHELRAEIVRRRGIDGNSWTAPRTPARRPGRAEADPPPRQSGRRRQGRRRSALRIRRMRATSQGSRGGQGWQGRNGGAELRPAPRAPVRPLVTATQLLSPGTRITTSGSPASPTSIVWL